MPIWRLPTEAFQISRSLSATNRLQLPILTLNYMQVHSRNIKTKRTCESPAENWAKRLKGWKLTEVLNLLSNEVGLKAPI